MQRLRSAQDQTAAATEPSRAQARADTLGKTADLVRRGADTFLEAEHARGKLLARFSLACGLVSLGFIAAALFGYGDPQLMGLAAGFTSLVTSGFALSRAGEGQVQVRNVAIDRGMCQAVAMQARHLGEGVEPSDERSTVPSADDVVNSQIDLLFKALDRSRQRLGTLGADVGPRGSTKSASDRIVPDQTETVLITAQGRRYPVRIAELSLTGVTLRGTFPKIGPDDLIQVGARKARLADVSSKRMVLNFTAPIVKSELNAKIVL